MSETPIPELLTVDQAFRAAFFMADQYVALEREPDEGLVLFHQYLLSDPARWEDWKAAIRQALEGGAIDPLIENFNRDE